MAWSWATSYHAAGRDHADRRSPLTPSGETPSELPLTGRVDPVRRFRIAALPIQLRIYLSLLLVGLTIILTTTVVWFLSH